MKKLIGVLVFGIISLAFMVSGFIALFVSSHQVSACLLLAGLLLTGYTGIMTLYRINEVNKELKELFSKEN